MPIIEQPVERWAPLPELAPLRAPDERARDRQWAIAYLQAARKTADATERNRLRRQAAELVLPRRLLWGGI